mgnify:FL=1
MNYLLPDTAYQWLKWTGLILCPALAALVGAVGPAWGLPHVDSIVLTINAVGAFIGALIGASHIKAAANG